MDIHIRFVKSVEARLKFTKDAVLLYYNIFINDYICVRNIFYLKNLSGMLWGCFQIHQKPWVLKSDVLGHKVHYNIP